MHAFPAQELWVSFNQVPQKQRRSPGNAGEVHLKRWLLVKM